VEFVNGDIRDFSWIRGSPVGFHGLGGIEDVRRVVENRRNQWSPVVLAKMRELSQLISQEKSTNQGPPIEITWAEIDDIGHAVGRLAANEADQTLQREHAEKFEHSHACPKCGKINPQQSPSLASSETVSKRQKLVQLPSQGRNLL
jgi:hypothetical protein